MEFVTKRLRVFSLVIFASFFSLFFGVNSAFADTHTLSGKVSNSSGNAISGAEVSVIDTSTNTTVGSTTTDGSGNYTLIVTGGTYNVEVTPPSESGFSSAIALSQNISSDIVLNFVLVPAGTVILSGHVYGPEGDPLANQKVQLTDDTVFYETITGSDGSYSVQANSGNYTLNISRSSSDLELDIPQNYILTKNNFLLEQSMSSFDIIVPAKKITIHVEDSLGDPVSDVNLKTSSSTVTVTNLNIGSGIIDVTGFSEYQSDLVKTDASGNVELWLFPNDSSTPYTVIATPPSGNNFVQTVLSNILITNDTNLTITMQQAITMSGHIYDTLGHAVPDQKVQLLGNNIEYSAVTDSSGHYLIQASSGEYTFNIGRNSSDLELNVPQNYTVSKSNFSLIQDTANIDIVLPLKKVTVHVEDSFGTPIEDVNLKTSSSTVTVTNLNIGSGIMDATGFSEYQSDLVKTDASGNVELWLFPNDSSNPYTLIATPPNGSNLPQTTLSNVIVTDDMSETIIIQTPVTLSGTIYDQAGNHLPDQKVQLLGNNIEYSAVTDSSGHYAIQANSGNYTLNISRSPSDLELNIPQNYILTKNNFSLEQSMSVDITVPAEKVIIHVQDSLGDPVSDVNLKTSSNTVTVTNLNIGSGIMDATGFSEYQSDLVKTDASGNVELWLFLNDSSTPYTLIATPPNESPFAQFALNNIIVTGNQTEIISLQYDHDTPVTTPTLSPDPNNDSEYANPVTVTLSATAADGYTVANKFYKIDGGSRQTYSGPFTITGDGNHTISYWSVDNAGAAESPKTKTFAIDDNLASVQPGDPEPVVVSSVTVDFGNIISAGYVSVTASDTPSGGGTPAGYNFLDTYYEITTTAEYNGSITLKLPYDEEDINGSEADLKLFHWDGSDWQNITIEVNTEENYIVGVTTSLSPFAIGELANQAPHVDPFSGGTLNEGAMYTANSSFTDDDNVSTSWIATVDYGDGSGEQSLSLNPDKTFSLSHQYKDNGTYTVTIVVRDNGQATGTTTATVNVNNVAPSVGTITLTPNSPQINQEVTVNVNFTDVGVLDTHTATINWGDGSATQTGTVTEVNGSGSVSNTHTYTTYGIFTVTLTVTDNNGESSSKTGSVTIGKKLTALSAAQVVVNEGYMGSDGLKLDIKAEVYKDNTLISSGQINSANPGIPGAVLSIPFSSFSAVDLPSGSALKIKVSVRNACSGSTVNSGMAILSYNAAFPLDSRFGATIGGTNTTYYLRANSLLDTVRGNSMKISIITVGAKCGPFQPFGTWTETISY